MDTPVPFLAAILCTSLLDTAGYGQRSTVPTSIAAQADSTADAVAHLTLRAHYDGSVVRLRWAPGTPGAWINGNVRGYRIERADLGMDADTAIAADPAFVPLSDQPLLPLDISGWKALHDASLEDNYIMVAGEMIHEALQTGNLGLKNGDILGASGTFQERMGFALLSADLSWQAAMGSALGIEDRSIQKGHRYLYRVRSLADPKVVHVDTGYVMFSTVEPHKIPRPIITNVIERDRCIILNWPRSAHEAVYTAFDIERSDDGGRNFRAVNKNPYIHFTNPDLPQGQDLITYTDSVPQHYKAYHYRLIGHTPFGMNGPPSDIRIAMARDRTAPPSPTKVQATEKKAGKITISWEYPENVPDLKGFHVVRGSAVSEPNTALTKNLLPKNARSFTDGSVEEHEHNYYMVVAVDTAGNPGISLSALGTVLDTVPPATPAGLAGRVDTSGVVHLSWNMGKESDLFGYYVYVRNQKDHVEVRVNGQPIRDTVFTDTISVRTLTEHVYYRVVAIDLNENQSSRGVPLELDRPDLVAPTAPVFTNYTVDRKGVHLVWAPSSSEDVVAHFLLRRTTRTKPWDTLLTVSKTSRQSTYMDLDKGTPGVFEYTIIAKDDAGLVSEAAKGLRLRMISMSRPKPVQQLAANVNAERKVVHLTWEYEERPDVRFVILRSNGDGRYVEVDRIKAGQHDWVDGLARQGTTYTYTVQAIDTEGQGSDYARQVTARR